MSSRGASDRRRRGRRRPLSVWRQLLRRDGGSVSGQGSHGFPCRGPAPGVGHPCPAASTFWVSGRPARREN